MSTDLADLRVRFVTFRDHAAEQRAVISRLLERIPAPERVLLETCHRAELVTFGGSTNLSPASDAASIRPMAREVIGRDAVVRVLTVAAGFDSAVPAEEQLLGQVRSAYATALGAGAMGPTLNELFRRAIRFGRRVRTHATPGVDRSLVAPAVDWLSEKLGDGRRHVIVVGTGEIGRRAATALATAGRRITILSRSLARADALRATLAGDDHAAAEGGLTDALLATADGVLIAVRSGAWVLGDGHAAAHRPWVVDLSAPSVVSPAAAAALGDRLRTVDELEGGAATVLPPRLEARLRDELESEADAFAAWLEARRGASAVALLHDEAERVRRRHLDRLRHRGRLDDQQIAAVEAASAAIVGELLHRPSVELRRGGTDAAVVRRLFGIDAS